MVKQKLDKIPGSNWNADVVRVENMQEMGIRGRIHIDFYTVTLPVRELENLFVFPAHPFSLLPEPPFPALPTLNFLTPSFTQI